MMVFGRTCSRTWWLSSWLISVILNAEVLTVTRWLIKVQYCTQRVWLCFAFLAVVGLGNKEITGSLKWELTPLKHGWLRLEGSRWLFCDQASKFPRSQCNCWNLNPANHDNPKHSAQAVVLPPHRKRKAAMWQSDTMKFQINSATCWNNFETSDWSYYQWDQSIRLVTEGLTTSDWLAGLMCF